MLALFFFFGEKTCVCVCVCRCSSTGPQSVNAPLGFVQRVRPADEPCQTTPVYLSFFCWDACPGWETLDEALEEEEKNPSPSGLHLCMQKYTQEYKHNAHISSHWCSVKQTHTRRGAEFDSYSFIFISPPPRLHSFLFYLNVLISVHTYFGTLNRVRDGPFSVSGSRRQSNSTWHASLRVTSDADAHFRRRAGATQHCWQNNEDRREAGPHVAFIK